MMKPVQRRLLEPQLRRRVDFGRFAAVRAARERGLTWEGAYAAAAEELAQTRAIGRVEAMKKSHRLVARTDGARVGRYAYMPPRE
jgi:hypothetical protein